MMPRKVKMACSTYVCSCPQVLSRKIKKQSVPQRPMAASGKNHGHNLLVATFLLSKLNLKSVDKLVLWLIINARENDL